MSGAGRAPWWFSGDDEQPEPETAPEPALESALESALEPEVEAAPEAEGAASPSMDWTALVAGAAKMVDWATEKVMAPHAEHTDPAEHPDCVVCRTVTLIGDPVGLMGGGQSPEPQQEPDSWDRAANDQAPAATAQAIRWIPVVESRD